MQWAREFSGELNVPRVWIPERAFVEASREEGQLSFTRSTRDGLFGLALGDHPIVKEEWNEFALPQGVNADFVMGFTHHNDWQTHAIATRAMSYDIEPLEDDELITAFLAEYAPRSSALPGNPEIDLWGCVRSDDGEIASVAAISEWESGEKMISSVATRADVRGRGYAQKVCTGLVGLAYDRGIERLHLVVLSNNNPAIRAYEKIGFGVIGKFATYSK